MLRPNVSLKKNVIAILGKVANPRLRDIMTMAVRLRQ